MYIKRISFLVVFLSLFADTIIAQSKTYDGYTFVFSGKNLYLYDMEKKVVNTWTSSNTIQSCAELLKDSSVIVSYKVSSAGFSKLAVPHGHFQIINWKGEVTWDYTYASSSYTPHHDIEPVYRTNDPKEKPTFLVPCYTAWGDKIVELRPTGKTTGEVIWEWAASDHLCESSCSDKADVLDKSKGGISSFNKTSDAMHVNNVSYNRRLDQIVISCKGYNEFIVVDHSTTTAEAKTTSGGKSGKGGSILYRWGSPTNYGISGSSKIFSGQHHCCWVPDTMPGTKDPIIGGGNFMAIDNGNKRALEIENPFKKGTFTRSAGKAFEPASFLWSYKPSGLATNEGSIQKLPNGNYLICTGGVGMDIGGFEDNSTSLSKSNTNIGGAFPGGGDSKIYEITPGTSGGTIVWELSGFGISSEGYRYAYSYLDGGKSPVKKAKNFSLNKDALKISVTRNSGSLVITAHNITDNPLLTLYTLSGKEVTATSKCNSENHWNIGLIPNGIYIAKFSTRECAITEKVSIQ